MKLFDAHCHLQAPELFPNLGNVMERAAAAGVERIAVCGTNSNDWNNVFQCSEHFSGIVPMLGIHPWFCSEHWKNDFQCLEKLLSDFPNIGIGECGLDFQEQFTNRAEQEACFEAHLRLAAELGRPVAIHCVHAWGRLLDILRENPVPRKIIHAFSGAVELVPELAELNCWFSICGNVTKENAKRVHAAAAAIPAERLLIETDAPDFRPAGSPRRSSSYAGQGEAPNEPANLIYVARAVAELRGMSIEEIATLTFNNTEIMFQ